jgi:hypothetical protein
MSKKWRMEDQQGNPQYWSILETIWEPEGQHPETKTRTYNQKLLDKIWLTSDAFRSA